MVEPLPTLRETWSMLLFAAFEIWEAFEVGGALHPTLHQMAFKHLLELSHEARKQLRGHGVM